MGRDEEGPCAPPEEPVNNPVVAASVRALLREGASEIARALDEEEGLPPGRRAIRPVDGRHAALHRLLLDAVIVFNAYGIEADPPSDILAAFRFLHGQLAVHVKVPAGRWPSVVVRGALRETPSGGGPVRALEVELCELDWDAGLGWVPAQRADGTALDLVLVRLLQTLRLARDATR
jgi:hypothetical protein